MNVKEIMSDKPEYLSPEATLQKLAEEMEKNDFGFIPIGENDRLIGTITDRDIAIRAVAKNLSPNTKAREIMTHKVLYCFEEDDIKDAAQSMEKQKVRRLIVLDKNKRMTGVISLGDIATKCHNEKLSGEILTAVSGHTH